MATTITRALADTYFSTRIENNAWTQFKAGDRDKAIQSALDVVNRAYGNSITNTTVDADSNYYPDRAVYHQALYILQNSDYTQNGEYSAPKWVGVGKPGDVRQNDTGIISPEAMRWLNWKSGPTVKIVRG